MVYGSIVEIAVLERDLLTYYVIAKSRTRDIYQQRIREDGLHSLMHLFLSTFSPAKVVFHLC